MKPRYRSLARRNERGGSVAVTAGGGASLGAGRMRIVRLTDPGRTSNPDRIETVREHRGAAIRPAANAP